MAISASPAGVLRQPGSRYRDPPIAARTQGCCPTFGDLILQPSAGAWRSHHRMGGLARAAWETGTVPHGDRNKIQKYGRTQVAAATLPRPSMEAAEV